MTFLEQKRSLDASKYPIYEWLLTQQISRHARHDAKDEPLNSVAGVPGVFPFSGCYVE